MLTVPGLRTIGRLIYLICEILDLLNAYIFMSIGIWRPDKHLRALGNS